MLAHFPSSSSYIKVNVNYPLLLSISLSSIIQDVIEKHYLKPVLTEIQAPSFPQGRHNWIPPEATDVKCRARGESSECCCFLYFVCFHFYLLFQGFQSDPPTGVTQLIEWSTIPREGLEVCLCLCGCVWGGSVLLYRVEV